MNEKGNANQQPSATPAISVVMPAHDCEDFIRSAIDSILAQSFTDFELLVCDDASTDATGNVLASISDPRIRSYRNEENLGYLRTVNGLFGECRGEYITFQDADDWSARHRLEALHAALRADPALALCGSDIVKHYPRRRVTVRYPETHAELLAALKGGRTSLFCGASIMFRRSLLADIGGYRPFFDRIGAEDIDWYLRIIERHRTANLPQALYFYRQRSDSTTQGTEKRLLSYFSADIALACHQQRARGRPELIRLGHEAVQSRILAALDVDDVESELIELKVMEQAAFSRLGMAISALSSAGKRLGPWRKLRLMARALGTFVAVNGLPNSALVSMAARSRLARASSIAAATEVS